jgi:hypothetical protein
MLRGLTTIWHDAVSTAALEFHVTPATLLLGATASVAVCVLTIWFTLRKHARQPTRELLAGEIAGGEPRAPETARPGPAWAWRRFIHPWCNEATLGWSTLMAAAASIGLAIAGNETRHAGIFFGAGSLLLISGIAFTAVWLGRLADPYGRSRNMATQQRNASASCPTQVPRSRPLTESALAIRALSRRRNRSLAVASLLACGSFLIAAIGAFKLDADRNSTRRASGTGGFALLGESSLPVIRNLNTEAGRDFYALNAADMEGVSVVPMRVRDGDEASCLNLNRAHRPRLLGVDPALLGAREAFSFAKVAKGFDRAAGWRLLDPNPQSQVSDLKSQAPVPAIGDLNSILWAMAKRVGDTIDYLDERGQPFQVRIVGAVGNSILQGNLLIAEDEFVRHFPSGNGYQRFLIDAPTNRVDAVAAVLSRALQDVGLELVPAARRLAAFNAVQNTYLNTFQILGGLGLLLGSAGLGVVVLRNVLERRSELALLLAVGFRRRALRRLVLSEHAGLLILGLALGIVAAIVSILPQWLAPDRPIGWVSLGLTLLGVLASGLVWTWLATWLALRGGLLEALRRE